MPNFSERRAYPCAMAYYKCPRCYSRNVYFQTEDRPTTYTHRSGKDRSYHTEWSADSVAYCKDCMVKADYIKEQIDVKNEWKAIRIFFSLLAVFLIFLNVLDKFFTIGVDNIATWLTVLMVAILIRVGVFFWRRA